MSDCLEEDFFRIAEFSQDGRIVYYSNEELVIFDAFSRSTLKSISFNPGEGRIRIHIVDNKILISFRESITSKSKLSIFDYELNNIFYKEF